MRYFTPELELGVLRPKQTELCEKFGGLPWGLPTERWPLCGECGLPLSHLFTLKHDARHLDLGKTGRILLAFMCNHDPGMCETWDMNSGANAVLILEETELRTGLTEAPDGGAQTETEAFITAWRENEDVVPEADEAAFFDDAAHSALRYEVRDAIYRTTKLGGLPLWIQFPEGPPVPAFRFVGQFDSSLFFNGPPPSAARAFCPVYRFQNGERRAENPPDGWVPPPGGPAAIYVSNDDDPNSETYRCEGPNFGDAGMGYLFLTALPRPNLFDANPPVAEMPQGKFLWQCT